MAGTAPTDFQFTGTFDAGPVHCNGGYVWAGGHTLGRLGSSRSSYCVAVPQSHSVAGTCQRMPNIDIAARAAASALMKSPATMQSRIAFPRWGPKYIRISRLVVLSPAAFNFFLTAGSGDSFSVARTYQFALRSNSMATSRVLSGG
jgi:hypothetical protein